MAHLPAELGEGQEAGRRMGAGVKGETQWFSSVLELLWVLTQKVGEVEGS